MQFIIHKLSNGFDSSNKVYFKEPVDDYVAIKTTSGKTGIYKCLVNENLEDVTMEMNLYQRTFLNLTIDSFVDGNKIFTLPFISEVTIILKQIGKNIVPL